MKKSQFGGVLVPILILLFAFGVLAGFIVYTVNKLDIKSQEEVCEQANQLAQKTDLPGVHSMAKNACKTIDLGTLPMKGYKSTKEDIMKNIADKTAKTWEIWLEGIKQDYFLGTVMPTNQKCFIQYTFNIKKDTKPIAQDELVSYLSDNLYKVYDISDRCSGSNGGWCREVCELDEKKVNDERKVCTGKTTNCCLKSSPCESNGGTCNSGCPDGTTPYISLGWSCNDRQQVCCIDDTNYVTYLDYLQANTGAFRITTPYLYPQDYKLSDEEYKIYWSIADPKDVGPIPHDTKIAETYAIVFSSRTKSLLWPESVENVNGIVIAPLNQVSSICAVQLAE